METITISGLSTSLDYETDAALVTFKVSEENGDCNYCVAIWDDASAGGWVPGVMSRSDRLFDILKDIDKDTAEEEYNRIISKIVGGTSTELYIEQN